MTKKILIFSLAYYPRFVSGAEAAIKEITDRIDDIEFHLITLRFVPTDPREEKIGNVFVYRIGNSGSYPWKFLYPFIAAFKAWRLHKQFQYNALWAMMTYMLIPVALFRIFGQKVSYAFTLQDGDPYEKVFHRMRIAPFLPLLNYGFRNATIIQAISNHLAQWPAKRGYKGEVIKIYNGANPRDLKESVTSGEVEAVKERHGKKPGDIWLVNTARLEHQKAQDDVIRSLQKLPVDIKFLVVGGGSDEAMLKNLVKELGLEKRVIFVGHVDRSEVTKYRKAADIFVAPSRSEGLGNAFLSAMASRLPVIATQEGGLAEFIFDEKRNPDEPATAWAVDKDSPEQIAEAVKDILVHPEKVERVTETARAMVLEKFDWDIVARKMRKEIFGKVLTQL